MRHLATRSKRFATRFIRFYWDSGIADAVPALTYYLVLSLAPFALGLAALAALLFSGELSPEEIAKQVARFLPVEIRDDVTRLALGTKSSSPQLLALAIAVMLWTSSGAIGVIERVLAQMTEGPRFNIIYGKLRNLGLGLVLALVTILATAGAGFIGGLSSHIPVEAATLARLVAGAYFLGITLSVALIFRYAPKRHLRWRSAFVGAIPASLMLQISPLLVGLYFETFARFGTGSIFLSLAVVLAGCMLLAQGFLIGAGIAARVEQRLDPLPKSDALSILDKA